MGMTLRNPSQEDFNQLKKMLADGKITPQQLQSMPMDVGYDGPPPQLDAQSQNMLAQMMQTQAAQQGQPTQQNPQVIQAGGASNGPSPQQLSDQASISQNADGAALSKLTAGNGYQNLKSGQGLIRMTQPDGSSESRYINSSPMQSAQQGAQGVQVTQAAPMKLYGYGNGTLSSLGNADVGSPPEADITRNKIDIPGLGKGYYSKDGRSAIISNPDGTKSQVLLGYDREASQAIDAYNLQREKTKGDIAQNVAQTAFTQAKTEELLKDPAPDKPKLGQGERMGADGTVEMIPGTAAYQKQAVLHGKALGAIEAVNTKTDNATAKIDEILSLKNKDAFENNFGGYTALITSKMPGATQDVRLKIESLKNDMKAAGLDVMRSGGGIGAMTEKEWPIVQGMIDSVDPKLGIDAARNVLEGVKSYMLKIKDNAKDVYSNEWGDTQFGKKAAEKAASTPLIRSNDTNASLANARVAIKRGVPRDVVIKELRNNGIMDTP